MEIAYIEDQDKPPTNTPAVRGVLWRFRAGGVVWLATGRCWCGVIVVVVLLLLRSAVFLITAKTFQARCDAIRSIPGT